MPHVSKNAIFSEKGIKNARLATLDDAIFFSVLFCSVSFILTTGQWCSLICSIAARLYSQQAAAIVLFFYPLFAETVINIDMRKGKQHSPS